MKCFSEGEIQAYIDDELIVSEKDRFEKHMQRCEVCYEAFEQQQRLVINLKETMNLFADDHVIIPSVQQERIFKKNKIPRIKKLFYSLSAACVLLLIMFVLKNGKTESYDENNLYSVNKYHIDANQPITERELVITTVNPDGDISEYIIE